MEQQHIRSRKKYDAPTTKRLLVDDQKKEEEDKNNMNNMNNNKKNENEQLPQQQQHERKEQDFLEVSVVDSRPLALFRIVFCLLFAHHCWAHLKPLYLIREIQSTGEEQRLPLFFRFEYEGLPWIPSLPLSLHDYVLYARVVLALLMAAGIFFRVSSGALFALFAHYLFYCKSHFNNHDYLYLLTIAWLGVSSAANTWVLSSWPSFLSISKHKKHSIASSLSQAHSLIDSNEVLPLKTLFIIMHFYATFWKLHPHWIEGSSIKSTFEGSLSNRIQLISDLSWADLHSAFPFLYVFMAFGGLLSDGLITLFLLFPKTQLFAFLVALVFHGLNFLLFRNLIGTFPLMALSYFLLFLDRMIIPTQLLRKAPWINVFLAGLHLPSIRKVSTPPFLGRFRGARRVLVLLFIAFQLLFPLRGFVVSDPGWNRYAYSFSWTMMLHHKASQRAVSMGSFQTVMSEFELVATDDHHLPIDLNAPLPHLLSRSPRGNGSNIHLSFIQAMGIEPTALFSRGVFPFEIFLTEAQTGHLSIFAEDLPSFAKFIKSFLEHHGITVSHIFARMWSTFNDYPFQGCLADPYVDLLTVNLRVFGPPVPNMFSPRVTNFDTSFWRNEIQSFSVMTAADSNRGSCFYTAHSGGYKYENVDEYVEMEVVVLSGTMSIKLLPDDAQLPLSQRMRVHFWREDISTNSSVVLPSTMPVFLICSGGDPCLWASLIRLRT